MNKITFSISVALNVLFVAVILAGVYKFNIDGSDVYVTDGENIVQEKVVYGEIPEIIILDPDAPDPDLEHIRKVEAEAALEQQEETEPATGTIDTDQSDL